MYPLLLSENALISATILLGKLFISDKSLLSSSNEKDVKALPANADLVKQKLGVMLNDISVEEFISLINQQLSINTNRITDIVNSNFDAIYTGQLAKAQDFVNGDESIDINALRSLLRNLLPERYSKAIKKIKRGQSAKTIIQIYGNNANVIADTKDGVHVTNVGDSFVNTKKSTIINRSRVNANADGKIEEALIKLQKMIRTSKSKEAMDSFDDFREEYESENPKHSKLKAYWNSMVNALPKIRDVAEITDVLCRLF